jgi:hypothetical protein
MPNQSIILYQTKQIRFLDSNLISAGITYKPVLMIQNLRKMDLEDLKKAYVQESEKLKTALLDGAKWEDIQEQRYTLIEFEIALYQRIRFETKPRFTGSGYSGFSDRAIL